MQRVYVYFDDNLSGYEEDFKDLLIKLSTIFSFFVEFSIGRDDKV